MTPGEEEIMRIYENRIYCPPDMIVKSGGFWIISSSMKPGQSCLLQTAPKQPVVEASHSDLELEELLRDTTEPSTPPDQSPTPESPLTPGAARITEGASYGTTEDMEAVVDELQVLVEERLPWLKDDISSSETSTPRTPSPDIELGDLSKSEEPTPELSDEVFRFRDPKQLLMYW